MNNVSKKSGVQNYVCEKVFDTLIHEIGTALMRGDSVTIFGLMKISLTEKGERFSRNPRTGQMDYYPPVKMVKVSMSKQVKDMINQRG